MITEVDKIKYLQESLLSWFQKNGRDFPWRKENLLEYQVVIAEVLLQRTKAETVAKFFTLFINAFPTWEALVDAGTETIAEYLRPVGLFQQKAKRIFSLATEMVNRKGKLPESRQELESIPLIGQYIANAIELIVFEKASPLLDVNMARVLERFFAPRHKADIRYDPYLQDLSRKVVTHSSAKEINWAILDFAAIICKARSPNCFYCPINRYCSYFELPTATK